jgi:APA family basic amino acid/polyamine antiporter
VAHDQLKRQIGLRTATALVVGEVIAVGIFLTPAGMAKSLGSPMWLLVVWLLMGGMALCGALCYGELAARYPEAGGAYVYLREAYGAPIAFLYGWMALLVMDPGLTAALAVGLATYFAYIVPMSSLATKGLAVATIVLIALINIRGVKLGGAFVRWLTVIKVGLLTFLLIWGFGLRLGSWSNFQPFVAQRTGSDPLIGALAGGLVGAFFSFGGWWDLSKLTGEVKDAKRTMPLALVYGVSILTAIYILTSAVFVYLVPLEHITSGDAFVGRVGEVLFGAIGGMLFAGIVIIAVLGSLVAVIMSAPRVYFAMANDGLFISSLAKIHPRFETPARAIIVQAVLASVLVVMGTFGSIISYFIFVVVLFLALTVVGLFVFRRSDSNTDLQITPGYPVPPLVFLVLIALLLFLLAGNNPLQAFAGVAVVLMGLPVYYFFFRGHGKPQSSDKEVSTVTR